MWEHVRPTQQIKKTGTDQPRHQPPRTPIEQKLAKICSDVLCAERVGLYDEFLDLGGDSILAFLLFIEVEKQFGLKLVMSTLFQAATVAQQAELTEKKEKEAEFRSIVIL